MAKYDIEALKTKVDIVKVISHYLEITKKGNGYAAICPFHNDSNPSLSISPTKQIFNCFVCHTGGDAFGFISKYKKIPYLAAVKTACEICGVPCDIKLDDHSVTNSKNAPLYAVLEDLCKYYEVYLTTTNGKEGFDYLAERKISPEIIKKFRIGFSPIDSSLSVEMMRNKKNHTIEALINAGILASGSKFKDRYFGRIMFPITDPYGRVVGFSGRKILENDESKYINSPETTIFHKGELLYNYFESKDESKKLGRIYILEGFMDVIALSRVNLPSVALMGTALTDYQVRLLKNLKVDIYLSLDSDDPGQMATINSAKLLAKNGVICKVVKVLDKAKDPDELLNTLGNDALVEAMNKVEEPLIHFAKYYKEKKLLETYDQKNKFLEEFLPLFKLYSPAILSSIIEDLVKIIELNANAIKEYIDSNHVQVVEDIPDDIGEIEDFNGFDFIESVPVDIDTPIKKNYPIYGDNAISSIYHILQKKKSNMLKDDTVKKDESRIINLIRSSRVSCGLIELLFQDVFYCDLVKKFYNYAVAFYDKNPSVKSLTHENLDKFATNVPECYYHEDLDNLIFVLHYYDNQLDSSYDNVDSIKVFFEKYKMHLKALRQIQSHYLNNEKK